MFGSHPLGLASFCQPCASLRGYVPPFRQLRQKPPRRESKAGGWIFLAIVIACVIALRVMKGN